MITYVVFFTILIILSIHVFVSKQTLTEIKDLIFVDIVKEKLIILFAPERYPQYDKYFEEDTNIFTYISLTFLPYLELLIGVISLTVNIYFAQRFRRVKIVSKSLKYTLIYCNISTAAISICHPVINILPESFYNLDFGVNLQTMMMALLLVVNHCASFFIAGKFILLGMERKHAYKMRSTYEKEKGDYAKSLLSTFQSYAIMYTVVRIVIAVGTIEDKEDMMVTFRLAFLLEASPFSLYVCHFICFVSMVYSLIEFRHLRHLTAASRLKSQTLSESYQLKEIQTVERIMRPLIMAYTALASFAAFCFLCFQYVLFFRSTPNFPLYYAIVGIENIIVGIYNTFSSFHILLGFKKLRAVFKRDLCKFLKIKYKEGNVTTYQTQHDHIKKLTTMWETVFDKRHK